MKLWLYAFFLTASAIIKISHGQLALVSNGNVLLGVTNYGNLCAPYKKGLFGLPDVDPTGFDVVCLRNGIATPYANGAMSGIEYTNDGRQYADYWAIRHLKTGSTVCNSTSAPWTHYNMVSRHVAIDGPVVVDAETSYEANVSCHTENLSVTHEAKPSLSAKLLQVNVTVHNYGQSTATDIGYHRCVNWNVYPTWDSLVSLWGVDDAKKGGMLYNAYIQTPTDWLYDQDVTDYGPDFLTSCYIIKIGSLLPGASKSFQMFYGLVPFQIGTGHVEVNNTLAFVQAEVAFLAKPSNNPDGYPYTFIWALAGVGGNTIIKSIKIPSGTGTSCFSGMNTIEVRDRGFIPLHQVNIGDYVKTGTGNEYTQVYGFSHFDHDREESFLQFHFDPTSSNDDGKGHNVLDISANHLVFVDRNQVSIPVPASDIVIGDILSGKKVSTIHHVMRQGVYAPLTMSGGIAVSGIRSSNYVNVVDFSSLYDLHVSSHAVWGPRRIYCNYYIQMCQQETYHNGYNGWARILLSGAMLLNELGWFVNMMFSTFMVLAIHFMIVLELQPIIVSICILVTVFMIGKKSIRWFSKST